MWNNYFLQSVYHNTFYAMLYYATLVYYSICIRIHEIFRGITLGTVQILRHANFGLEDPTRHACVTQKYLFLP